MRMNRTYILGKVLRIVGYILYGIGAVGAIGIISAGYKIFRVGFNLELILWCVSLLLAFFLCMGIIKLGHNLHLYGKKLIIKHKATIFSKYESLNTVLYLRSFTDDFITSQTQPAYHIRGVDLPQLTTEEETLVKEFERFGKFISAANPQKDLPNTGAIQISFKSREWRERIKYLMKTSSFVLVRIGEGEHLKWEIDNAIELVPPKKLLFLIPFNENIYLNFKQRLKLDRDIEFPKLDKTVFFGIASISAIIYFDENFEPKVSICHDAGYRSSASKPFKPILRYSLEVIYKQNNIPWNAPPIPKQKYIPVIFFSYLVSLCLAFALSDLSIFFSFYMVIPLHIPLLFGIVGLYRTIPNFVKAIKQKEAHKEVLPIEVEKQWEIPEEYKSFYEQSYEAWSLGKLNFIGENFRAAANLSLSDYYDLFRPMNGNSMSIFFKDFPAPLPREYLISVNDVSDEDNEPWFILTNHRILQKNGINKVFHQIWIKDIARIETSGFWTKKLVYHLKCGDVIIFEKVDICVSKEYIEKLMSLEA